MVNPLLPHNQISFNTLQVALMITSVNLIL